MSEKKYEAYAYDYDTSNIVYFYSDKPHCASCLSDEQHGCFMDDPCCCHHQADYSYHRDQIADSDIIKEVHYLGKVLN